MGVLRASSWGFPSAVGSGQLACCLPVSVDSRRASRLAWICGHASGSCGSGTWHVLSAGRPERNLRRAEAGPLHASDPLRCAHSLSLFLSLSVLARACVLACARISSTAAAAACARPARHAEALLACAPSRLPGRQILLLPLSLRLLLLMLLLRLLLLLAGLQGLAGAAVLVCGDVFGRDGEGCGRAAEHLVVVVVVLFCFGVVDGCVVVFVFLVVVLSLACVLKAVAPVLVSGPVNRRG